MASITWLGLYGVSSTKNTRSDRSSTAVTNEWIYRILQTSLNTRVKEKYISEPLAELLRQMLAWDPQNRPNARAALTHRVWKPIAAQMKEAEGDRKRNREEKMKVFKCERQESQGAFVWSAWVCRYISEVKWGTLNIYHLYQKFHSSVSYIKIQRQLPLYHLNTSTSSKTIAFSSSVAT